MNKNHIHSLRGLKRAWKCEPGSDEEPAQVALKQNCITGQVV